MDVSREKSLTLYLLDTNTIAYIINERSRAARSAMEHAIQYSVIAISAISEGELLYGLARKPEAVRMRAAVEAMLSTVLILPWDSEAARAYGTLRAKMAKAGKSLSNLDMLIAAQAIAANAVLVTRDAAFSQVEALHPVANWATDI